MGQVADVIKIVVLFILGHLFVFNFIFAVIIVFFQRKEPKSVWAWLLLLYFIPILGFLFYLLAGADTYKRRMFRIKEVEGYLSDQVRREEVRLKSLEATKDLQGIAGYTDLVLYNLETSGAMLATDNDIDFFTDGNAKFDALIDDMEQASHFIHIQYYIIRNDVLFKRIVEVLRRKVAQGVEVRLLFDGMGCRKINHHFWKKLRKDGILVAEFFPAFMRRLHLRINYRNHRKIVVVDNRVAYVGGFNIGKEYIGLDRKFGYWRDTHLRVCGSAILGLQLRFILDWNYVTRENLFTVEKYFN
ncbi:MAG: phospholipase D-like domain-containing protein, partial [Clostridium sp.]|nr:phospholipase D-like domain-containing protein [Clostridium sp.]